MKKIYTYGTLPAERNLTVADIIANKVSGQKMVQTNAFATDEAKAAEQAKMDMLICRGERYDEVRAGAPNTFVTAVMLMSSYTTTNDILAGAVNYAGRGADAIMTPRSPLVVEAIAREGIAVQGHVGLVPSLSTSLGGLRIVGKSADEAISVFDQMRRLEDAGAFGCEVECVAQDALAEIRKYSNLVISSIGSGSAADIIFLFMSDLTGDTKNPPRHAKAWGELRLTRQKLDEERLNALMHYRRDVLNGSFPDASVSSSMPENEHEKLLGQLEKRRSFHR
jgi:3-methyl-2-oxobutanoate hydroxymethyltransferase|tara:strand:- start:456 stop:1295 length:840 start_codon:yes stop_codon:yes gene_type:complete